MGTWDVTLFSDDTAADIRGYWQDGLQDGESPEVLTQRLIKKYAAEIDDPDESVIFWLALAASQFETGYLQTEIRDKALTILKAGGDISRWAEEDATLAGKRKLILEELAAKLSGPQPKPKKFKKFVPIGVHFNIGDVIELHNKDTDAKALVVIVARTEGHPKGTVNPVGEILLWEESSLPTRNEMQKLPTLVTNDHGESPIVRTHMFVLMTATKKQCFTNEFGKVVATGIVRRPAGNVKNGALDGGEVISSYTTWPTLTRFLGHKGMADDIELTKKQVNNIKRWNIFKRH
jgi:hypothetical protein